MNGPLGNSEFCFPRDQSLSAYYQKWTLCYVEKNVFSNIFAELSTKKKDSFSRPLVLKKIISYVQLAEKKRYTEEENAYTRPEKNIS